MHLGRIAQRATKIVLDVERWPAKLANGQQHAAALVAARPLHQRSVKATRIIVQCRAASLRSLWLICADSGRLHIAGSHTGHANPLQPMRRTATAIRGRSRLCVKWQVLSVRRKDLRPGLSCGLTLITLPAYRRYTRWRFD